MLLIAGGACPPLTGAVPAIEPLSLLTGCAVAGCNGGVCPPIGAGPLLTGCSGAGCTGGEV
ncbi:MAG: hypothetical protein GY797_10150 [Deltaproteobacteria bacterium]|nr:hypothetical protein [Deltaproteobacteria bacterium]